MATSNNLDALPLPDDAAWTSIGLRCGRELRGGHQSRVFAAELDGRPVAVKLTDGRLVDDAFEQRLDVMARLAEIDESVVGPLALHGRLATGLAGWRAVVSPFVVGRAPDLAVERDVRRMASTLARLHRSLTLIGPGALPVVAALADAQPLDVADGFGPPQLLHGDFSDANVLLFDELACVIDFDECGTGPVEFEVGNTLYMVLFDAWLSSDLSLFERFREWFVSEYRSTSGREVADVAIDVAIRLRTLALGRWLARPDTAPIGIRNSTAEWRTMLAEFVRSTLQR